MDADKPNQETKAEREERLHKRLLSWRDYEKAAQADERYQAAVDEDFYDGLQWQQEDADVLMERGQAPLVYNKVKPAINWLLGTEKRTRIDFDVLPREQGDEPAAEAKTKLLKYVADVNRTVFERSKAFEDAAKCGLGWLEDGVTYDPDKEIIYSRYESWRNIWRDSLSIEPDLSDMRYIFREKVIDLDVAQAMFPAHRQKLVYEADNAQRRVSEDEYYMGERVNSETIESRLQARDKGIRSEAGRENKSRDRVTLIECWYRVPVTNKVCNGGAFHGEAFDDGNDDMQHDLKCGDMQIIDRMGFEMRVALMTEAHLLHDQASPYTHNEFPFTAIWCYRRKRDGSCYGVIRDIRDPQEDYNKRASKALYLLSVNRVIADKDAVDDKEELREEAARPDSVLLKKKGTDLRLDSAAALANAQLELMHLDGRMIQDVSGITDENMGRSTNATSGRAIMARQEQGAITTESLFDSLRYASQIQGEKQLALLEQFYTDNKVIRILGKKGKPEYLHINAEDDDGLPLNMIAASKADFIVAERDYRESVKQAMFETMMDLIAKLPPQMGMNLLDLVLEFADVPNKDEIIGRIRKMTGQSDPWSDPSPEEQQQQAQQAQLQQQQQQLAMQKLQAEIAEQAGKAEKLDAEALLKRLDAMLKAQEATANTAMAPGMANAVDSLVKAADTHSVLNPPQPAA